MGKIFTLVTSPFHPSKLLIHLEYSELPFQAPVYGSYNVFASRLLGLTYAQYLRFCRDVLGAELYGKNCLYVIPLFSNSPELQQFIKLLNAALKRAQTEYDFRPKEIDNNAV